jgi:magnesium-transporting ATPase (P-type)
MPRDANELGTRLGAYSDAIAGFSFAQNVAFCLALGTKDFAENAIKGGWLIPFLVLLASAFYAFMISMCHRRQDVLLKPLTQTPADRTTATIRIWHFLVIAVGTLMTLFGIIMTWYGYLHPQKEHLWMPFVQQ